MKQLSNSDFSAVLWLLDSLSRRQGTTIHEKEDARKAGLLVRKLRRNDMKFTGFHKL